ncbi:hypothetical protein GO730_11420 [Spirosoma sp. HMF3257]|uniref:Uncharacterized protein n=1 Tax=Spirosoma telluris TaxID=2183553 RepID=A0A327NIN2_9BACT|nr:hypothetical protein [Spirosoma telluris]RAI74705.1 hypothetical protein HMF3257_11340 [Spirosoma telluris]
MKEYPEFKRLKSINQMVTYAPSQSYWKTAFDKTYSGKIDTWDYQWVFTIWKHQGLCIIPNQNLITNIGFGEGATNTLTDSEFANLPTVPIEVNQMSHPSNLVLNKEALTYAFAQFYQLPSWWKSKIKSLMKALYQGDFSKIQTKLKELTTMSNL